MTNLQKFLLSSFCALCVVGASRFLAAEDAHPDSAEALESHKVDSTAAPQPGGIGSSPLSLNLSAEQLADFDHEDFGDWAAIMPGFYPLDFAGYGAAYRGQMLGFSPKTVSLNFRGRACEDHLLGAPELGWIPPEALGGAMLEPFALHSPGAGLQADLRFLEAVPPSSRIATRDGFYGLGTVDFDLAQKIASNVTLNGGGRVGTYGGRLQHSEGYGLNLRSEVVFQATPTFGGWGGLMQNKMLSQVPFSNVSHDRDRYDGDISLQWKAWNAGLYGFQQRETYGSGENDAWDELGLILRTQRTAGSWAGDISVQSAAARWRLKGQERSTTSSGGIHSNLAWQPQRNLCLSAYLGLDLSDDFAPARHLGARMEERWTQLILLFLGASQHQATPSRFETSSDFDPGTHFLPYDPAFFQYPELKVTGTKGLGNEIYSAIFAGPQVKSSAISAALAGFWHRVENPIRWQVEDGELRSFNAQAEEGKGALGWINMHFAQHWEFGSTGSYLYLQDGEQRLFPQLIAHAWGQYQQKAFKNELELRLRVWEDFWGKRSLPVPDGWQTADDAFILSARISAYLLGVHLYWGVNNILDTQYELLPGFPMMHKEEVWGISWNFRD